MKKSLLFNLFSLLLMSFLFGCSDEEKIDYGQYVDPNTQVLTVTQNEVTASTFTFSVEAENADIPYVAMHIDKATIDGVAKSDLPAYLMGELAAKATVEGVSLEEYLAKVSHKGSISNQKITALTPGNVYELVAFAFTGTEPATKMESIFFETPAIDKIDCAFNVEVKTKLPYVLGFNATSAATDEDLYYFPALFYKSGYDTQLEISYKDIIYNNAFAEYWKQAADMSGGDIDKAVEILIKNGVFVKDLKDELVFGGVDAGREYKFLIGAYKLLEVNGSKELVMVSDVAEADAATEECNPNEKPAPEYKISCKYTDEAFFGITVTPPADAGPFAIGVLPDDPALPEDKNQLRDLYLLIQESNNINVESYKKETTVSYLDIHPGTAMKILVFEYFYGPLSEPKVVSYEVPGPTYEEGDLATLSTEVKSTYNFDFTLKDGNTSVPYFVSLGNGGQNDLDTKDKVSERLNKAYKSLNKELGMDLPSFLYGNSKMEYTPAMMSIFVGPQEFNSGNLQPLKNEGAYKPYKVYCYPLKATDNEETPIKVLDAIAAEQTLQFSSKTTPKFTAKYFTAKDASEVFGKEYPENQIMVVMDYNTPSQATSEEAVDKTCYGVVKDRVGVTMGMDDVDIMYNYKVEWTELLEHNLVFTMCDNDVQYYGLTYVESGTEYSKVGRKGLLPTEGEITFGTKEELQALYDKAHNPAPVQPATSSLEKYISPFMTMPSVNKDEIKPLEKTYSPVMVGQSSKAEHKEGRTVSTAKASMVGVAY